MVSHFGILFDDLLVGVGTDVAELEDMVGVSDAITVPFTPRLANWVGNAGLDSYVSNDLGRIDDDCIEANAEVSKV
jgi:hypothetical protein